MSGKYRVCCSQHTGTLAHVSGRSRGWGAQITLSLACLSIPVLNAQPQINPPLPQDFAGVEVLLKLCRIRAKSWWPVSRKLQAFIAPVSNSGCLSFVNQPLLNTTVQRKKLQIFHSLKIRGNIEGASWVCTELSWTWKRNVGHTTSAKAADLPSPSMHPLQIPLFLCIPQLPWPSREFFW